MKRIALLGMPNTGKSTFFNRITGASARIGNWPGVTVDLMSAKVLLGDAMVEIIDLPGIYDLHGFSDDEQVVRHFLENNSVDLLLVVLNACQVDRQLSLALQLKQLNVPSVLLLNMADEARKLGITIDDAKMSELLGLPVVMLSAKYGHGYREAHELITTSVRRSRPTRLERLREQLDQDTQIESSMDRIFKETVHIPAQMSDNLTARVDRVMLHPWLGLPLFFAVMYLLFQAIFFIGAPLQSAVSWILMHVRQELLDPALAHAPVLLRGLLLDGIYNGVGTVAAFVPIIILFFLFLAMIEDTGYLSRAAFLMDALMSRLGLDGRSFVMILMGFGCNVPALMGTRVMRSRALRLLTMLIIPFSLCSARLQVFIFITAALFTPHDAPLVLFSLYMFSFATAMLTALLMKGHFRNSEPFILELPPYRLPTIRQMLLRGWIEVRHFLLRASKFIIAGVVLVWLLTHFPADAGVAGPQTLAGTIGHWLSPILSPIGIDERLAVALIFGFVAKEIVIGSLAVIYHAQIQNLSNTMAGQLNWLQAYSFMLFTLIYTPCLSTVATIRSESKSLAFTIFSVAWPLVLAWLLSFLFYQGARLLGL